jgi:hypothetical protein
MQVFAENRSWMPRRNAAAAAFLVASLGISTNNVSPPATQIALTVNAPAIFNGNINLAQTNASPVFAERITYQPVNRAAKYYLAASQFAPAGPGITIPPVSLQLQAFAPQVLQATPILVGQDLQYNKDYREDWHLPRRNYAFLLNQGPTINANVLTLALQTFAPTVKVTGTVTPPTLAFNLGLFAPAIVQANSGLVSVPLLQITLSTYAPNLFVTGSLLVAPPALTLTFPPLAISQGPIAGQANLPTVPYISGVGPWDITLRTYG